MISTFEFKGFEREFKEEDYEKESYSLEDAVLICIDFAYNPIIHWCESFVDVEGSRARVIKVVTDGYHFYALEKTATFKKNYQEFLVRYYAATPQFLVTESPKSD